MKTELIVENTILINAPIAVVWDALVNPEQTKRYMFGCETVSNWQVGSPLLWRADYEGKEMVFVKGYIVAIEAPTVLIYSTFDPNNTEMEDKIENYLNVTYRLSEENGQTRLYVSQGDFSTVAQGEKRYAEVYNNGDGWNPVLVLIKKMLEEK
jgi:uncharacterized protein YndB with AHSA1/START domain